MKAEQVREPVRAGRMIRPVLGGLLFGMIVSLVCIGIFALIFTLRDLPQAAVQPMASVSLALGALAGSVFAARAFGAKGMLVGAVSGLLLFLILYVVGAAMHRIDTGTLALVKLILSILCGCIGGIAGVNTRRR